MKLIRSLFLLNSVFAGPTRPSNIDGAAIECPTDCVEILRTGVDFKGARPDYDYGEECDMEEIHKKCEEELPEPTTTGTPTTEPMVSLPVPENKH